jgi:hypothetical protein
MENLELIKLEHQRASDSEQEFREVLKTLKGTNTNKLYSCSRSLNILLNDYQELLTEKEIYKSRVDQAEKDKMQLVHELTQQKTDK